MITLRQFQILNACTDGPHLFYAPFAAVNYGGQVFEGSRDPGADRGGVNYENDQKWSVVVSGRAVADDILTLITLRLLDASKFTVGVHQGDQRGAIGMLQEVASELHVYDDYGCVTYRDHYAAFGGYGPHEFEVTEHGLAELNRPEYGEYLRQLGWDTLTEPD